MPSYFGIILERNLEVYLLHRWKMLLVEILSVAVIFALIIWNPTKPSRHQNMDDIRHNKWKLTSTMNIEDISMINRTSVAYISDDPEWSNLVIKAAERLNLTPISRANEKVMETQFSEKEELCGIVVDSKKNFSNELAVKLRFPNQLRSVVNEDKVVSSLFWQYRLTGHISDKESKNKTLFAGIFMREGFLQLQHAIFQEWLNLKDPNLKPHNLTIAWFTFPGENLRRSNIMNSGLFAFLCNFTFCLPFCGTVYVFARSCQKNILPHLWRYGYRHSTHWWGNIIVTSLELVVMDVIIICALYLTNSSDATIISFQNVSFGYVIFFLLIYNLQFLVCAIFYALIMEHGRRSVLLTLAVWFASYGCFTTLMQGNLEVNYIVIILLVLHFNNAFPLLMAYMYLRLEDNQSDYWIFTGCMIANVFLYLFLVSWVQYAKPGLYLQVYKYDFLYLRTIFCGNKSPFRRVEGKKRNELFEKAPSMTNFENGPMGVKGFVNINNVCTNYKLFPGRHHLKNINMTLYEGEITVLWGHHSSGKTSLICILAGWQVPILGTITFGDLDLHKDWVKTRRMCDVSMPNNALYDGLTVRSTLVHFIRIKQEIEDSGHLRAEVRKWLDVLRPSMKNQNQIVRTLTFDQKRLLCLCVVLACDTKVILLDEPTQHMRSHEKQLYWSILRAERTNRVIFLATFSLDEANYIGNRIALLENGKLLAYGTPFFLKTTFTHSYYLVINKRDEAPIVPITRFLLHYIPETTLEHGLSNRIVYKVPTKRRPLYQHMLINLEKSAISLGIHRIQMLSSSLNEVAIALTKDKVKKLEKPDDKYFEMRLVNEYPTEKMQMRAVMFKKMVNQMPHLWPGSMILITIVISLIIGKLSELLPTPPARHHPSKFGLIDTARKLTDLPPWKIDECSFIRIKKLTTDSHVQVLNSNTHFLNKDSYHCHKDVDFEKYLTVSAPPERNHFAAIEFISHNNWTIWVNSRKLEAAPVALNLAHNLILKSHFGGKSLTKISHDPFLMPVVYKFSVVYHIKAQLRLPLIAGIVMPFMLSSFILALIEERHSHMWVIQRLAGLHLGIYWTVTFIWDWLTFVLFALIIIVLQLMVNIEGIGYSEKFWIYVVLMVYGTASMGWIYIMSLFMQKSKTDGFLTSLVLGLATGIVAYNIYVNILLYDWFFYILMMSPHFAMLYAISCIYLRAKATLYCEEMCDTYLYCHSKTPEKLCELFDGCCEYKFYDSEFKDALSFMLSSAVLSFAGMFIVSMIRARRGVLSRKKIDNYTTACYQYDDPEVKELRERVSNTVPPEIYRKTFLVDQLEYDLPKKAGPIHTISLEVTKGQCISIFGNRRSGVSRLTRLLTGINPARFGAVFVEGIDMREELMRTWRYLGYCPPNRGIYNNFTARELMLFLSMIAGIPNNVANEMMSATFKLLNMRGYVNKKCGHLSVEKQRKVNLATAIVIFKTILVLDQPTNGLPLSTSQEIWNALQYLLKVDRTIILTSCAVIECRFLAQKMLIYERGEMFAYGGFFYLLERYTKGIFLDITLKRDGDNFEQMRTNFRKDVENLFRYVTFLNSEAELCTRVDNCLSFYLPIETVLYSALFGSLEKNKTRLNISDYTINQGTIEEIMYTLLSTRDHRMRLH